MAGSAMRKPRPCSTGCAGSSRSDSARDATVTAQPESERKANLGTMSSPAEGCGVEGVCRRGVPPSGHGCELGTRARSVANPAGQVGHHQAHGDRRRGPAPSVADGQVALQQRAYPCGARSGPAPPAPPATDPTRVGAHIARQKCGTSAMDRPAHPDRQSRHHCPGHEVSLLPIGIGGRRSTASSIGGKVSISAATRPAADR